MNDQPDKNQDKKKEVGAIEVINPDLGLKITNPIKNLYTAIQMIAGCGWIETSEGTVLIDTLLYRRSAKKVYETIHEHGQKVKYIIYTHGHLDHILGANMFLDDNPEIIASEYLPSRLDNYKMLAQHRNRMSAQQFGTPEIKFTKEMQDKIDYIYPTKTFLGELTFKLGDITFELHSERAETDDAVWIWIPELKAAFIGDLMIGSFPNVGNPWKPTRFALDWAKALEKVRAKEPEYLFYNGAAITLEGKEKVTEGLTANIEVIRDLHDQVVDLINQDMHISEMIHTIKVPERLKNSPYLFYGYSRPEFFVYNVYRWYHGYFDGNPAHLLPRPEKEINREIYKLIGEPIIILKRVKELVSSDQKQLGLQLLDVLIQSEPENIDARKLRIELLKIIGSEDNCLMSRNAWVYFIKKDKEFLKKKGINID